MNKYIKIVILITTALFFLSGCKKEEKSDISGQETAVQKVSETKVENGWTILFDGANLDSWQMIKTDGWKIEESVMSIDRGGNIWTVERFRDFIFECEFKVSPNCNSGIFFRTGNLKKPVQTGIEMQVSDSAGESDPDKHDCGAVYDLLEPNVNAMKSAGEWNHVTITCNKNVIIIVMNGAKIIEMDLNMWTTPRRNPDGTKNKFNTALKDFPREGHIGFQDHGDPVWCRNVRIKAL